MSNPRAAKGRQILGAAEARTRLGQIIDDVERRDARYLIAKNGRPKVVLLSLADYLKSIVKIPASLARAHAEARRKGSYRLTLREIEQEIAAIAGAGRCSGWCSTPTWSFLPTFMKLGDVVDRVE